ncbi:helix-turn-helix domain-containing protein [Streptomyces sp. GC420]|uniref:helix-turn-helix domain-containing protein n=1 Tax=Streptomyces sp. GC420 TaxID=2697568 RepID=UPI0014151C08|nr:helix-turn-helix domain-containing protein [Streptomyces sp. GC420]NBM16646.1 helix-turn-helix domain-containing protein [Streptomyces sp. GC420]
MLRPVFDGADISASERFSAWSETCARQLTATHLDRVGCAEATREFHATLRAAELGPIQLADLSYGSLRARRTPRLIRAHDPETYQLALVRTGRQHFTDGSRDVVVGPGSLLLYDSAQPFTAHVPEDIQYSSLVVGIPRKLLPLPEQRIRPLAGTPVHGNDPMARLLCRFLDGIAAPEFARGPDPLTGTDSVRLGGIVADLTLALLARRLGEDERLLAAPQRDTLLLRIRSYIERHLDDHALTPADIASAHHISLRYLHRLFEEQEMSVAAWIRARRLERCRRDLLAPELAAHPVGAIAARWGFPRPADFSRAFRRAYGVSPREYRRLPGAQS